MDLDSSDEEQMGGLAAPPLRTQEALQRLYDPKITQGRFTGLSLLDPSIKRLRPTKTSKSVLARILCGHAQRAVAQHTERETDRVPRRT